MGETMSREQAAAKLVAMMVGDMSLHRSMSRSSAKDAAIGAVTDKAVDLILEVDVLRAQLSASQAREREAVERAEKAEHHERVAQAALSSADCRYAGRVAEMSGSHCPIGEPCDRCAADRLERKLESALAAARKALEEIAQAPGDNIGVWCRDIARAALNGDTND